MQTEQNKITPELIKAMYIETHNKIRFLQIFGTKRFHIQSQETLNRMFNYLQAKNNKQINK
jgi:hypothetical protein